MKPIKYTYLIVGLIGVLVLLISCNGSNQSSRVDLGENLNNNGRQLMAANCVTCHSPDASMDNRLAPPMIAIKKHYIDDNTSLEVFTQDLLQFLNNPTEANSRMPGAVRKFGLMPKLGYTEEQITDVAEFIYHADIQKPDWFDEHFKQEHENMVGSNEGEEIKPADLGLKYAMATKAILGKNLMGQITAHGTAEAIDFCSTKAIHLTDSMSIAQNVKIKRVSDRPRNPNNQAEGAELQYIVEQKTRLSKGEELTPFVSELKGKSIGYYPITTNTMCLQCHGVEGEELSLEINAKIKELYPSDIATGYKENELRGIWVVEF